MKTALVLYDPCGEGKFYAQAFTELHKGEKLKW